MHTYTHMLNLNYYSLLEKKNNFCFQEGFLVWFFSTSAEYPLTEVLKAAIHTSTAAWEMRTHTETGNGVQHVLQLALPHAAEQFEEAKTLTSNYASQKFILIHSLMENTH